MKRITNVILFGVCILIFSGCITNANISKQFTSAQIGCDMNNIEIINEKAGMNGMHTWIAKCKGKKYFCTYHYGDGAKCTEEIK